MQKEVSRGQTPHIAAAAFLLVCLSPIAKPQGSGPWDLSLTAGQQQAIARISANSLLGNLSFLASDLLQGRPTPSTGQDIAAEFIASQFRRAGLKPAGDDGFYQTVPNTTSTSGPLSAVEKNRPFHNVVGLLPGSDQALSDTYILLTAHYDGTGPRPGAGPAQIWNAANDNGSGTVSVMEIASALASLEPGPRRSIVFMTFFGEEKGELGSKYYASHPIFPIEKTVAMINLEQLGRTDSSEGDQTRRASLTGFDLSDMGEVFRRAGEAAGITVFKDSRNSDTYFSASDNLPLAQVGVPAHTLCVAFDFPDYHGAGDKWQKVNYENMAATDRMTATALLILAQSNAEPRWSASNPRAAPFLEAWRQHRR